MVLQRSIDDLRTSISVMARQAEAIFELAASTLRRPDERTVREVRELDARIDTMELEIDRACMELLLKEPLAVDFRYAFSCVKIIKELERVGDQSKTVAKWALRLPPEAVKGLEGLLSKTREALNTAVEALIEGDVARAEEVMQIEFQVDELEDVIIEKSTDVAEAFVAKALERIGDLATNIAENVIFSIEARDVRHGGFAVEQARRPR